MCAHVSCSAGVETRAVMNASTPQSKMGLFDLELNDFSKVLFAMTVALALTLTALKVSDHPCFLVNGTSCSIHRSSVQAYSKGFKINRAIC